jgi:hypothetical protein
MKGSEDVDHACVVSLRLNVTLSAWVFCGVITFDTLGEPLAHGIGNTSSYEAAWMLLHTKERRHIS